MLEEEHAKKDVHTTKRSESVEPSDSSESSERQMSSHKGSGEKPPKESKVIGKRKRKVKTPPAPALKRGRKRLSEPNSIKLISKGTIFKIQTSSHKPAQGKAFTFNC